MTEWLIQPIIGATIGYITNYVAIKMLFRPYYPKHIFGRTVPFTPGLIPKRKSDIAKSISAVVCRDLLDKESLVETLCDDKIMDKMVKAILTYTLDFSNSTEGIPESVGKQVSNIMLHSEIKNMISVECDKYLQSKLEGNIISKLINHNYVLEISDAIGSMVESYYENSGRIMIQDKITLEMRKMDGMTIEQVLLKNDFNPIVVSENIKDTYTKFIYENITSILSTIDLENMIENKIENMDVKELEKMVLGVMNKELNAIVYIGAILGALIGILNIFL